MKDTYIANDTDVVRNDIVIARTPHNDDARRIAAALNRFELIPTDVIESMPESGVAGLAIEHSHLSHLHNEVEALAKDGTDAEWMELRGVIANAASRRDQQQSTTAVH